MWRRSKHAALFAVGAIAYFEIELHWRYFAGTLPVHWTMPILGGVLFLLLGGLNEWLPWEMPFWGQCLFGQCGNGVVIGKGAVLCAVQIDDVKVLCTRGKELARLRAGVLAVNGHAVVVALGQAHHLAAAQVNGWK